MPKVKTFAETGDCPFCGADNGYITMGDLNYTDNCYQQESECSSCGSEWDTNYELASISYRLVTLTSNDYQERDITVETDEDCVAPSDNWDVTTADIADTIGGGDNVPDDIRGRIS